MNILAEVDDKPSIGIASRDVSEVLSNCKTKKIKCHMLIVIPCILDIDIEVSRCMCIVECQELASRDCCLLKTGQTNKKQFVYSAASGPEKTLKTSRLLDTSNKQTL